MFNRIPEARTENAPDLSKLDPRPEFSAQAVCDTCGWKGTDFGTFDAINQAWVQAGAFHNLPGHTITVVQVPLR